MMLDSRLGWFIRRDAGVTLAAVLRQRDEGVEQIHRALFRLKFAGEYEADGIVRDTPLLA